jgi:hypothetical protein
MRLKSGGVLIVPESELLRKIHSRHNRHYMTLTSAGAIVFVSWRMRCLKCFRSSANKFETKTLLFFNNNNKIYIV